MRSFFAWSVFLLLLSVPGLLQAHGVGNPGDPVRLLISDAKSDARIILIRVPPEKLAALSTEVSSWYGKHYEALNSKLADATPVFVDDAWAHCALAVRTEMRVYFSYPKCQETVRSKIDAIKLWLHEVTHLEGNDDEVLADDLANSIYNTWINLDINNTPRWDALDPNGAPQERSAHASVTFQDEDGHDKLFVWGGCNENNDIGHECSAFLDDGGIFDLSAEPHMWQPVAAPPASDESHKRAFASAVFTGLEGPMRRKIIIFGGCASRDTVCRDTPRSLLIYDLATETWVTLDPGAGAPEPRLHHHAFWTGKEMLIWGGVADPAGVALGRSLQGGALYDPVSRTWRSLPVQDAPAARRFASAVLTGNEQDPSGRQLIVYGGCDRQVGRYCPNYFNDGAVLSLSQGRLAWKSFQGPKNFAPRAWHSAVWTGKEMIVWGGLQRTPLVDGAIFEPITSKWLQISGTVDEGRFAHKAIWTGDRMLVWGGQKFLNEPASSLHEFFLPTASTPLGRWNTVKVPASPVGRWNHTAEWLGGRMLIWGGISEHRSYLNSGGLFVPQIAP